MYVYPYMHNYTEQIGTCSFCFMLILKKFQKIIDIKIKNNIFCIHSKFPGMSNCIHTYSFGTLTFLNFNI